jgi:hypothetical protein
MTAPTMPAMITCAGLIRAISDWCAARFRIPRNDQKTAFATSSGDASLRSFSGIGEAPQPGPPRPFTSKKVYESVMVFMSSGSPGATMKTTGILRTSPGPSVCSLKQKHSILVK